MEANWRKIPITLIYPAGQPVLLFSLDSPPYAEHVAIGMAKVHLGAAFSVPLEDTHDGLRGFEICDPDGYVLFFGRPR
jgi:hypothetical protein